MSSSKVLKVVVPVAVVVAVAVAWLLVSREAPPDATQAAVPSDARSIHDRVLVLDAHVDIVVPQTAQYADDDGGSHASPEKLKAGGVDAVVLALAVGPGPRDAAGFRVARAEVDAKLAAIREFVATSEGAAVLALSADAIEAAHRDGRIAVTPGFLNARALGKDLAAIDPYYEAGVRVFGLTHAGHNDWADSSRPSGGPLAEHGGLSPLGKRAITRLNELGIVVDVSQLTTAGLEQVLAITRTPVIASHSGVRALVENTRNLSDAELDAIKVNGGVVHVPAFNSYLLKVTPEARARLAEVRGKYGLPREVAGVSPNDGYPTLPEQRRGEFNAEVTAAIGRASVSDLVDHIDYIVQRVGIDHVGIGTDFNHGSGIVDFENEADAPNVTSELVRRGYTEEQIAKIWSGNFLRVLRAAEAARKS